ncbi:VanZ family protein [Costertonia aggregata]|uniref:VanZ family protein n=1 Tax=Costertonia aggregata TaxID=343403 RepID=A0A7H9AMN7_9FLAO|nr:VanZ family protein [Costertonia aggregata]QLG44545.1 VanZ family protein [Costertonia aggregata]
MLKKATSGIAFVSWMATVTYLSLATLTNSGGGWLNLNIPHKDKIAHFIFYFVATFLGFFFFLGFFDKRNKILPVLMISLLFAITYGMVIEILQYNFFPNRSGDVYDALANSLGAFAGAVVVKLFFASKSVLK